MWKDLEKDGSPEKEGPYLTCCKHVNYPYNVGVNYYDGDGVFMNKGVLPFTHWHELPPGPNAVKLENCCATGMCC